MNFVDTHTHLYDEQFDNDRTEAIKKAIEAGVNKMFLPNCNSETIEGMLHLSKQFPDSCYPMMGLHPCYVKDNYKDELGIVEEHLNNGKFSAVGEIGLDYYWDTTFKNKQIEAFETQIDWALQHDLPIVIHTRNSLRDGIDIVKKKQNGNLKGVFHCFGGSLQEAHQIIDIGFYLGIGGVVTFKNSKLGDTLKEIELQHIVLETDAPYLAPTPYRGKRNESSYIPLVAEKLVDVYNLTLKDIADVTTSNALKLFS